MRFSFHTHVYKKLASARTLLGVSLLALSPALGWAQTTYTTSQNFDTSAPNGGKLSFAQIGSGQYVAGRSNGNDLPKNSNRYASGTRSFGVEKNEETTPATATTQINFRNVQLTGTATLEFRLAVFANNVTGQNEGGLATNGSITVSINPDSAAVGSIYREVLRIQGGGSGAYWSFDENFATTPTTPRLPAAAIASYDNPRNLSTNNYYTANSSISTHYSVVRVVTDNLKQAKIRVTLTATPNTSILIDDVSISSTSPLPVELVRFTAQAQEKNVALHWITASEKNSDYFEVQRSTNGATFNAIGKVQGEGTTSSISNYLFTDRAPVAGLAYYRLRQVDFDGTESYSPVQAVTWQGGAVASFYPNPSAESITFTGTDGRLHYRIYNASGQQVAVGEAESGSPVDLHAVPAGIYLLELSNKGQRSVQRFVRL